MKKRGNGRGTIYRPKGSAFWWIAYYSGGRRRFESTGQTSKGAAEKILTSRIHAIDGGREITPEVTRYGFDEAAQAVLDDFKANGKRSIAVVERRIEKHLAPWFGGRRMAAITTSHVVAYVAKRQGDVIITRKAYRKTNDDGTTVDVPAETKPVSNAEINRELQVLKRAFNLALEQGRILSKPAIKLLKESAPRAGFFETEQLDAVIRNLPAEIGAVIRFASITGWRIPSEVLTLQWRNIDMKAGEVRLDAGTTKSGAGRVFYMTDDLRTLLEEQEAIRDRMKADGRLIPWVFHRSGERIVTFHRVWRAATLKAGCPGKIPHDLRRTVARRLIRCGVSERVAMQILGHRTPSIFARYNVTADTDLRAAAALLNAASQHSRNDQVQGRR